MGQDREVHGAGLTLEPDFVAVLHMYPSEVSGRRSPIVSGFRAMLDMHVTQPERMTNDGVIDLIDADRLSPGETCTVHIGMLCKEFQFERLYEGFTFELLEGAGRIGQGRILRLLNEDMRTRP
jgi:hypothetical protein